MPEHQDLSALCRVTPRQQRQPAEHLQQAEVHDPNSHGRRSSLITTSSKPAGPRRVSSSGTVHEFGENASTIVRGTLLVPDQEGRFTNALISITKEKVKGKACGFILDQVAPKPEDSDRAAHSTNPVSETIDELMRQGWRVPGNDWRPFVKWSNA